MTRDDLFNINAGIVKNLVIAAAKHCPEVGHGRRWLPRGQMHGLCLPAACITYMARENRAPTVGANWRMGHYMHDAVVSRAQGGIHSGTLGASCCVLTKKLSDLSPHSQEAVVVRCCWCSAAGDH
jgi:hypothetical protein